MMNEQVTPTRYEIVSWDMFHHDARTLSQKLKKFRDLSGLGNWWGILCVTRGGLIPAGIVARELEIRLIETTCLVLYEEHQVNSGQVKTLKPPSEKFLEDCGRENGRHILVIDDLVDTGQTAKVVRNMLPRDIYYATLYTKPAGLLAVNASVKQFSQDTWVRFPWDTGLNFQPPLAEEATHTQAGAEVLTPRGE